MNSINEIRSYVTKHFSRYGINKNREIIRLIYEILKINRASLKTLKLSELEEDSFDKTKARFLQLRYPGNFNRASLDSFFLPKLSLHKKAEAKITGFKFYPKNIYIEEAVQKSAFSDRVCVFFSDAKIHIIPSLKEFSKNYKFKLEDYNKRAENLFLIKEKYDFFKSCPCTSKALACGYSLLNLGFGCPYECTYCFLQGYQNFPGIIIPVNLESFFSEFSPKMKKGSIFPYPRIGTGEFTDSLVFDNLTGFSKNIIEFFSLYPEIYFEFKTKSSNIANILSCRPRKNIVVSWSVNPQTIIDENEFYTASLKERISAAKQCSDAGFGVGFHFDPIIHFPGWENEYSEVIDLIFSNIPPDKIYWISLGTLRMPKELKKSIENRFPKNILLDGELLLGFDGKLRYNENTRIEIYKKMLKKVRSYSVKPLLYLCMEPKNIWEKSFANFMKY